MLELQGRTAVVTGAGSGIGRALALRFAEEGMNLAIADLDPGALGRTRRMAEEHGARVVSAIVDVGEQSQVASFADLAFDLLGGVHLLCNNAGVFQGGQVRTRPAADFTWTLRVNLWGILHGLAAFVPRMIDQGAAGHVVNTCSTAGLFVGPGAAPYTISKWDAFAATLTLAQELAVQGADIGVSALCPGGVTARIHESERARPAELRSEPGEDSVFMNEMIRTTVANGISPEQVAEDVVQAVRANRFLVLTHPVYTDGPLEQATALLEVKLPQMPDFERRGRS